MKCKWHIELLLILLTLQSCTPIDYGLEPMNYQINPTYETGYDIHTEGNNPSDNIIFSSCNSYVYDYIIEIDQQEYFGKWVDSGEFEIFESWDLLEKTKSKDSTYIEKFVFAQPQVADAELSPDQSVVKVYWLNSDNTLMLSTSEGIIENHKNLWMHPLRGYHMWPTFTAPWPYVKFPINIGDEYTWWKKLDGGWGSEKYLQWDTIVHFDYIYKVTSTEVLNVGKYSVECYKIEAEGTSELGKTKVYFYFNPRLGFVKFDYYLMDDSKIQMKMIEFEIDCGREFLIPEYQKI